MNMDEYLSAVSDQIRDKHAKGFVSDEIRTHIEEQASAYMNDGMDREESYSKAVVDMGDPVTVGAELDRIHRPHLEWRFLLFTLFISVLSIMIQYTIRYEIQPWMIGFSSGAFQKHCIGVVAGITAMIVVYRMDYTVFLGRSRIIGGVYLTLITLLSIPFGYYVNGSNTYIGFLSVSVSVHALLLLYLPVFAGILYEYRGRGNSSVIRIALWMIAPILSRYIVGDNSTPLVLFITIIEVMLFFMAVRKDWYMINKRVMLCGSVCFAVTVAGVYIYRLFHSVDYQRVRIETWLARLGVGSHMHHAANYVNERLIEVFSSSHLLGKSDRAVSMIREMSGFGDDLILGTISAYCGIIAVAGVMLSLSALAIYIFYICIKQKNHLGSILGCACGMIIALQSLTNIMIVFGLLPLTGSTLPFISRGTSMLIVDYILAGLVLSIYRYKDIRTDKTVPVKSFNLTLHY